VLPVTIRATGTVSKSLKEHLSNILRKHKIKDYRKSHVGHCVHTVESAAVRVQNIQHGK